MSDSDRPDVVVTREDERSRYAGRVGDALAGFAAYRLAGDTIVFTHTEVDPAFEGRGVGGALARAALDDVRAEGGLTVVPTCPFIRGWIARHPGYSDLVARPEPTRGERPGSGGR